MFAAAAAAPFVTVFLYRPYCAALHALARRRLRDAGTRRGLPVFALPRGGAHEAIAVGDGAHGFLLASEAALAHPAWELIGAHLAAHVRHRDGLWLSAAITASLALAWVSPWLLLPSGLGVALLAQRCERRADSEAALAATTPEAAHAYAAFIATDGMAHRASVSRWVMRVLRRAHLASHPAPHERARRFERNFIGAAKASRIQTPV